MIKSVFKSYAIYKIVQQKIKEIEKAIIAILERRGEEFVAECRSQNTWSDDTGNLRSSIAYFIYKGSTLISSNNAGSSQGVQAALNAANTVKRKDGTYYLIGVAGMNYAAAVESKGYNVISTQALQIIPLIEGDFKKLKNKLSA